MCYTFDCSFSVFLHDTAFNLETSPACLKSKIKMKTKIKIKIYVENQDDRITTA